MAGRLIGVLQPYRGDPIYGGDYRLVGVVDELGAPGQYRVWLHLKGNGMPIREALSDESGNYVFNNLADLSLDTFAIAFDHGDNPVNAAISDQLTFEPMP
jgi:hypothetical protein